MGVKTVLSKVIGKQDIHIMPKYYPAWMHLIDMILDVRIQT